MGPRRRTVKGGNEWDRDGAPLADPQGLARFVAAIRAHCPGNVNLVELDAHINDVAFSDKALEILDRWTADGTITMAR